MLPILAGLSVAQKWLTGVLAGLLVASLLATFFIAKANGRLNQQLGESRQALVTAKNNIQQAADRNAALNEIVINQRDSLRQWSTGAVATQAANQKALDEARRRENLLLQQLPQIRQQAREAVTPEMSATEVPSEIWLSIHQALNGEYPP